MEDVIVGATGITLFDTDNYGILFAGLLLAMAPLMPMNSVPR
jgi:hypothetical protein